MVYPKEPFLSFLPGTYSHFLFTSTCFFLTFGLHPFSSTTCFSFAHRDTQLQPVNPRVPAAATRLDPSMHRLPQVLAGITLSGNHQSLDCLVSKELFNGSFCSKQSVHPYSLGGLPIKMEEVMAVISTIQLNGINTDNMGKRTFKRKFEEK